MERTLYELRLATRALARRPLFAAVAALSLAIGVGANAALFSAVNAFLLQPMPGIATHDRVVELGRGRDGDGFDSFTWPDFVDLREQVPALAAAAAFQFEALSIARDGEGIRANGMFVSPEYFRVLGVEPHRGRVFAQSENVGGEHEVAVLSHGFWTRRFGADDQIVGATVRINRRPYTVVGVAPPDFRAHLAGYVPDVFLPMSQYASMTGVDYFDDRRASWHMAIGLLAPGADLAVLGTQLDEVGARLAAAYPETNARRTFHAAALGPVPAAVRGPVRVFLGVLMAMVGLILLITCANVAGMFLSRAVAREREIAVRLALGGSRAALVRQLTAETLVVFALGGAAGVALAVWLTGLVRPGLLPVPLPLAFDLRPDATVVAFAAGLTLLTGLAFGLLPAAQATRVELSRSLGDGGRGGGAPGVGRLRRVFAAGQVGLSVVLLLAAGLFARSLQRVADTDTGFSPAGAWMTGLDLSIEGYDEVSGLAFQRALLEHLGSLGWVEAAAMAIDLPLDLGTSGTVVVPEGWPADAPDPGVAVDFNRVTHGYFEALGISVLAGRPFSADDDGTSERVAVVSRTFAERVWPGEEPLGRELRFGRLDEAAPVLRVVGVVEDVKNGVINEVPRPFVYVPAFQDYAAATQVVVRVRQGAFTGGPPLREAIRAIDPSLSLSELVSLERYTALGILPQRAAAGLAGALGALALFLSALGVYGVVASMVTQRTREIGVRMALGASASRVLAGVLRGGLTLALPGLALGGAAGLLIAHLLRSLLLGLSPLDPVALAGVVALLVVVVALASLVPARRAARLHPSVAMRSEGG